MAQPFNQQNRSPWTVSTEWLGRRILPVVLVVLGLIVLGLFAYSSSQRVLNPLESGLFAVLTAVLNIGAAWAFGSVGRVDPKHARSAVRRLLTIGRIQAADMVLIDKALATGDHVVLEAEARRTSADLRTGYEQVLDGIRDWNDVHTEALREVLYNEEKERRDRSQ